MKVDSICAPVISSLPLPLMRGVVHAGFPSPADDYMDKNLDLNEHLVSRPAATFFVRSTGSSMIGAGIQDGALLIVDRSEPFRDGRVVVAIVDGGFTVKRFRKQGQRIWLEAANPDFKDIEVQDTDASIWGVVTYAINKL